jgi:hypothetical protein
MGCSFRVPLLPSGTAKFRLLSQAENRPNARVSDALRSPFAASAGNLQQNGHEAIDAKHSALFLAANQQRPISYPP